MKVLNFAGILSLGICTLLGTGTAAFAQMPTHCTVNDSGKFVIDLDIDRSVVVHDDTLDVSYSELGMPPADGDEATDSIFSFNRAIGAILASADDDNDPANGPNTAPEREALLTSMLRSFRFSELSHPETSIRIPVNNRIEEGGLKPDSLLDESVDDGMIPVGLFIRFDLADEDFTYCGEHRIVYARKAGVPGLPPSRFLLIFEGIVPNPQPDLGEAGCRPVANFWAELTTEPDQTERARKLQAFFFKGDLSNDGDPADVKPAVHFENYGGDARGQVRGNVFLQQPWLLREWRVQLSPTSDVPEFIVETVKQNPLAEFYKDVLAPGDVGEGDLDDGQVELSRFQGEFLINHIEELIGPDLDLMEQDIEQFEGVSLSRDVLMINGFGFNPVDRYNEFQSVSQLSPTDPEEWPSALAGSRFRDFISFIGDGLQASGGIETLTVEQLLNRAGAISCGGCHNTSPGDSIGQFEDDSGNTVNVDWPAAWHPRLQLCSCRREQRPVAGTDRCIPPISRSKTA